MCRVLTNSHKAWVAVFALSVSMAQASSTGLISQKDVRSSQLSIYSDQTLVEQVFSVKPSEAGQVVLTGIGEHWQQNSIEMELDQNNQWLSPERLTWKRGGLERERLYHSLVGKQVELIGGGLNVSVQGTLVSYDNGLGLVQGINGRQYLIDWSDPQGIRLAAREEAYLAGDFQPSLTAQFANAGEAGTLRLSYITSGLRYSNQYRMTISNKARSGKASSGKTTASLELSSLLFNDSAVDYSGASMYLVSGDTGRSTIGRPQNADVMMMMRSSSSGESTPERYSEMLVTAMPEGTSLKPHSMEQVSLYKNQQLSIEKVYQYDFYGRSFRGGQSQKEKPRLSYFFKAERDLPEGRISIYEETPQGVLLVSGESFVPRTLKSDPVSIPVGQALAVRLQRELVRQEQSHKKMTSHWKIRVENDNETEIKLLLIDKDYSLSAISNIEGAVRENLNTLVVSVPANSEQVVSFESSYSK